MFFLTFIRKNIAGQGVEDKQSHENRKYEKLQQRSNAYKIYKSCTLLNWSKLKFPLHCLQNFGELDLGDTGFGGYQVTFVFGEYRVTCVNCTRRLSQEETSAQ